MTRIDGCEVHLVRKSQDGRTRNHRVRNIDTQSRHDAKCVREDFKLLADGPCGVRAIRDVHMRVETADCDIGVPSQRTNRRLNLAGLEAQTLQPDVDLKKHRELAAGKLGDVLGDGRMVDRQYKIILGCNADQVLGHQRTAVEKNGDADPTAPKRQRIIRVGDCDPVNPRGAQSLGHRKKAKTIGVRFQGRETFTPPPTIALTRLRFLAIAR